jgi:hypothetical protein
MIGSIVIPPVSSPRTAVETDTRGCKPRSGTGPRFCGPNRKTLPTKSKLGDSKDIKGKNIPYFHTVQNYFSTEMILLQKNFWRDLLSSESNGYLNNCSLIAFMNLLFYLRVLTAIRI